jgi:multicomponent Na+:H+ antiporter subunit D
VIVASILLPLAAGCLTLLLGRRASEAAAFLAGAGTIVASVLLAVEVWRDGPVSHLLGGWGAPIGIELRADGLSAAMLVMCAAVSLPVILFARSYFSIGEYSRGWSASGAFWPLMLFLWTALNALFLSSDIFNLYVALEVLTLSAVALVTLSGGVTALVSAMRYLLAAFVGSMLYLLGVAILYAAHHTLDLTLLAERVTPGGESLVAVALISGGLALKTALFPVHFWLPRAHASAPAPVSALLSSLVITASFYLILRLWVGPFAPVLVTGAGQIFGVLGAGAIIWGSVQALRQKHLKVMIAYSTVAQIGYLFLLLPLITSAMLAGEGGAAWGADAWNGGIYHAISHALAKAAMFLAAGSIVHSLGSDQIVGISGIARHLPVSTYAFGIAGMSLIGLPPSGGFVAKWLLLSASFASGQWWWAVVILAGGVLTAGYVFLVLGQELSLAPSDRAGEFLPVPRTMEYTAMALALIALVLGVRVSEPLALLRVGLPFPGG